MPLICWVDLNSFVKVHHFGIWRLFFHFGGDDICYFIFRFGNSYGQSRFFICKSALMLHYILSSNLKLSASGRSSQTQISVVSNCIPSRLDSYSNHHLSCMQGRNADSLAQYFGEDPARCPFEQGMQDHYCPVSVISGGRLVRVILRNFCWELVPIEFLQWLNCTHYLYFLPTCGSCSEVMFEWRGPLRVKFILEFLGMLKRV